MVNSLSCLRHHTIIRRDNEDDDIGDLSSTSTHRGERGVTRCIDEGDRTTIFGDNSVRSDVLGNSTRLFGGNRCASDSIEQGGLTVVDVTHDGHNRRAWHQVTWILFNNVLQDILLVELNVLNLVAQLVGDDLRGILVDRLVDGRHYTETEELRDHLTRFEAHLLRELSYRDRISKLDNSFSDLLLVGLRLRAPSSIVVSSPRLTATHLTSTVVKQVNATNLSLPALLGRALLLALLVALKNLTR